MSDALCVHACVHGCANHSLHLQTVVHAGTVPYWPQRNCVLQLRCGGVLNRFDKIPLHGSGIPSSTLRSLPQHSGHIPVLSRLLCSCSNQTCNSACTAASCQCNDHTQQRTDRPKRQRADLSVRLPGPRATADSISCQQAVPTSCRSSPPLYAC